MAQNAYSRWTVLAVVILIESTGGLFYMFSAFSQTIKQAHWPGGENVKGTLTQSQVDQVGDVANLGGNFGIHIGFLYDRCGSALVIALGTLLGVIGWTGMWAALAFASLGVPYHVLLIFSFCQGHGQMATDVAVVPIVAKIFPLQRGTALGLAKAFVGLSGALAMQLYDGFFAPHHIVRFMLFLASGIAVLGLLAFVTAGNRELHDNQVEEVMKSKQAARRLNVAFRITFLLMAEIGVSSLLYMSLEHESHMLQLGLACSMLVILAMLVLYIGTRNDCSNSVTSRETERTEMLVASEHQLSSPDLKNFTPFEALLDFGFWLQVFATMVGGGSGLVIINNIAQMNLALGGDAELKDVFVTIISLSNCAGRLCFGAVSDYFIQVWCLPRPFFFGIAVLLMGMTHVSLLLIPSTWVMYVAAFVGGLTFGGINALSPIVANDLYGDKHFGSIYTFVSFGFVPGSYLSAWLAGRIYDEHAEVQGNFKSCKGVACFQLTELICAVSCSACSLGLFFFASHRRQHYLAMYHPLGTCRSPRLRQ